MFCKCILFDAINSEVVRVFLHVTLPISTCFEVIAYFLLIRKRQFLCTIINLHKSQSYNLFTNLILGYLATRLLIMDLAKFQVRHGEIMCSVCHYAADSQSALEAHIRKHQEDPTRPYFCHSCDARFSTRKRWDQHLPKHQTETPFVCQVSYGLKP